MTGPRLTIAFVSDAIYPYNIGGKEKRLFELSTRLAKKGHKVHIYCMKWWKENKKLKLENGVILHAISKKYALYSGKRRSIFQAIIFAVSCFSLLKEDFDILDVDHMPHLVLFPIKIVSIIKRKPMFVTWNEVWGLSYWMEYLGGLGIVAFIIEWLSAQLPTRVIAVSKFTQSKLQKVLLVRKQVTVVPNGINIKKIQSVVSSKMKSDVVFAGRLLQHKHVDLLIRAMYLLKGKNSKIKAVIIGDGPEKLRLKQLVATTRLQRQVRFFNFFKKQENVYALMKSSKVFVLPSTREGFGIAALEALACGIPVVTVSHKDNAAVELIKNKTNGYIAKLRDTDLADKILLAIKNTAKEKIIQSVQQYDWNFIANTLEQKYLHAV